MEKLITTLGSYKETIGLILIGLAGSITHILNKARKGEKLTIRQHIYHIIISGFVGCMTGLLLQCLGITGALQAFLIGMASYLAIQIIGALEMIKAKDIYNIMIKYIGKK